MNEENIIHKVSDGKLIFYLVNDIVKLLKSRTNNRGEIYFILRYITILYEKKYGLSLNKEQEERIESLINIVYNL